MKKKVVFRSGSLRMGGLERILIEVLQTIDREKYDIYLLIEDDCGKENIFEKDIPEGMKYFFLKPEPLIKKCRYHRERKSNLYHKIMYNLTMLKEERVVLENSIKILKEIGEVDLLIDFDWGATKYIEKLPVKKSVVWIHNSVPKLKKKPGKIERFGKRLAKYDLVVGICDEMKEEIEKIYPFLKGKVERVYNPFNFERIERLSLDRGDISKEQEELLKENYVVAVSRLDCVQKDYETLIEAFSILKDRKIQEKLYIVGDGPDRDRIQKMIEKKNLEEQVKLIGLTKNPYIWMKNADFFVHSSKYEGLPTVLIEAMICGKVVISSDCPTGPKEILRDGECGILYPVGDAVALADGIEKLLKDRELKEKLLKKIEKRREEFNKDRVIEEYQRLIDEI